MRAAAASPSVWFLAIITTLYSHQLSHFVSTNHDQKWRTERLTIMRLFMYQSLNLSRIDAWSFRNAPYKSLNIILI